jgi:arabinofuranosyltransferase
MTDLAGPRLSASLVPTGSRAVRIRLASGFVVWAAIFVARSSIAGIDGRRYFCLFDDAMISMRYAANLVHGWGLVWNPGERVEGYTNLLWTLLMAVPVRVLDPRHAVLAIQLAGVVLLLGVAAACRRLARDVFPGEGLAPTFAFAFALFHYPFVYWTLMGMETGLVVLLSCLAMIEAFATEGQSRPSPRLVALLGLAYLTRPDALIVAGLILAYRLRSAQARSAVVWEGAGLGALVVGHTALRLAYYGALLPNTYRLKVEGVPAAFRIANGLAFVAPWVVATLPLLALAARSLRRDSRRPHLLLATACALLVYQIWIGGDLNDHWRFLCGAAVLLAPLAVAGAKAWIRRLAPGLSPQSARLAAAVVLAVAATLPGLPFAREQLFVDQAASVSQNRDSVNVALHLRRLLKPDATIAVFWAGAIPYYAPFRAYDLLGKSDVRTAGLPADLSGAVSWSRMKSVPGHNKYDLRYTIVGLRPTFLEHDVWGREDMSAYVREHYVAVPTPFGRLLLLKESASVRWSALAGLPSDR